MTANQVNETTEPKLSELLTSLSNVGIAWARYGLTVGRVALETHAKALDATAKAVGNLANALNEDEPTAKPVVNTDGSERAA